MNHGTTDRHIAAKLIKPLFSCKKEHRLLFIITVHTRHVTTIMIKNSLCANSGHELSLFNILLNSIQRLFYIHTYFHIYNIKSEFFLKPIVFQESGSQASSANLWAERRLYSSSVHLAWSWACFYCSPRKPGCSSWPGHSTGSLTLWFLMQLLMLLKLLVWVFGLTCFTIGRHGINTSLLLVGTSRHKIKYNYLIL